MNEEKLEHGDIGEEKRNVDSLKLVSRGGGEARGLVAGFATSDSTGSGRYDTVLKADR